MDTALSYSPVPRRELNSFMGNIEIQSSPSSHKKPSITSKLALLRNRRFIAQI